MTWNRATRAMFALAALSLGAGYASGVLPTGSDPAAQAAVCTQSFFIHPVCKTREECLGTWTSPTALPPIDFTRVLPICGTVSKITITREYFGSGCSNSCGDILPADGLYIQTSSFGWQMILNGASNGLYSQTYDNLAAGTYRYYEDHPSSGVGLEVMVTIESHS